MKELIQTERIEHMARIARDGANIAQEIANQEKADVIENNELFPKVVGQCYFPLRKDSGDEVTYSFAKNENKYFISETDGTEGVRDLIVSGVSEPPISEDYFWGEDYFLVMCIENIDTDTAWAHVKFWVGDVHVAGQITNDSDVKDFKYYAVIEL
jgi:hypothetical protein